MFYKTFVILSRWFAAQSTKINSCASYLCDCSIPITYLQHAEFKFSAPSVPPCLLIYIPPGHICLLRGGAVNRRAGGSDPGVSSPASYVRVLGSWITVFGDSPGPLPLLSLTSTGTTFTTVISPPPNPNTEISPSKFPRKAQKIGKGHDTSAETNDHSWLGWSIHVRMSSWVISMSCVIYNACWLHSAYCIKRANCILYTFLHSAHLYIRIMHIMDKNAEDHNLRSLIRMGR